MITPSPDADGTKANREIDTLRRSKLFRNYEQVFSEATGLPLALRPVEYWQLAHHGKKHENPFCALLAERPATLAVCLQAHQDMIDHTGTEIAPWTLVEANDKQHARIKVLKTMCERIEAALKKRKS